MNSDLRFITNDKNQTLLDRFRVLIKDTQFFDVLVGYFYNLYGLTTEEIKIVENGR